ncbi:MAG TPA: hypothetical protein VN999_13805 [Thermoanaerobaculia bacterium]|nr:hypothetical protein [Thermoanaerobaculia bacterium]
MKRNALYIFLILLLATALTALAQSPTTSNMGGSETKAPYGATLDHPNPSSAPSATTEPNVPAATPATTPSTSSTTTSTTVDNTSGTAPDTSTAAGGKLPRTASDLPLLATIGLLALGGALTVRSIARRNT